MSSGIESARELLVEGVDVPKDAAVDEAVMVAALSRGANLPLTLGWSCQWLLGARMLVDDGKNKAIDNVLNTLETRVGFGDDRPFDT